MLCAAAPATLTPKSEQNVPSARSSAHITISDSSPPNNEKRKAVTLPISSEEIATRHTTTASASRAETRVSANSVTTLASPNLTPGTGTTASSGNSRSTSDSTTASAVSRPQSVNFFVFKKSRPFYDTIASISLVSPVMRSTTRLGRQTATCPAWVRVPVRTQT